MSTRVKLSTAIVVLLLMLIGCTESTTGEEAASSSEGVASESETSRDPIEIEMGGYPADSSSWARVIANPLNRLVVEGTVVEVGEPRWTTRDGSEPAHLRAPSEEARNGSVDGLSIIVTPVTVKVDDTFENRADVRRSSTIQVAVAGGEIDQVTVISEIGAPPDEYRVGRRVVLFLHDPHPRTGTYTPNFVAFPSEDQSRVTVYHGDTEVMSMPELRHAITGYRQYLRDTAAPSSQE